MIGNIAPEGLHKWQLKFENVPAGLDIPEMEVLATGAPGMQGICIQMNPPNDWPRTTQKTIMSVTESHAPVGAFLSRWHAAVKASHEAPYRIYSTRRGAFVEYRYPSFRLQFRSLRLAQVFAKSHAIDWNIEALEYKND